MIYIAHSKSSLYFQSENKQDASTGLSLLFLIDASSLQKDCDNSLDQHCPMKVTVCPGMLIKDSVCKAVKNGPWVDVKDALFKQGKLFILRSNILQLILLLDY